MIFKPYPKQNAGTHKWVGKGKWCETKVAGKILVLLRAAEMEQPMEGCFLSRDIYEIVCTDGFFFFVSLYSWFVKYCFVIKYRWYILFNLKLF